MPTIGVIVERHRAAAGLTREDLARASGLSPGYIADLEQDRYSDISTTTVKKLRAALVGLTCDELLDATAPTGKPRRPRGRPRKPAPSAAEKPPPAKRGRPPKAN